MSEKTLLKFNDPDKNKEPKIFLPEEIRRGAEELGVKLGKEKETTGQLKFKLKEIGEKMTQLRRERDKERKIIVDDRNMELIEKGAKLKAFDAETIELLKPLKENRDEIERDLKLGGHA